MEKLRYIQNSGDFDRKITNCVLERFLSNYPQGEICKQISFFKYQGRVPPNTAPYTTGLNVVVFEMAFAAQNLHSALYYGKTFSKRTLSLFV